MAITLQDHTLEVAPFDGITRFSSKVLRSNRSSQPEAPLRSVSKQRTKPNVNEQKRPKFDPEPKPTAHRFWFDNQSQVYNISYYFI